MIVRQATWKIRTIRRSGRNGLAAYESKIARTIYNLKITKVHVSPYAKERGHKFTITKVRKRSIIIQANGETNQPVNPLTVVSADWRRLLTNDFKFYLRAIKPKHVEEIRVFDGRLMGLVVNIPIGEVRLHIDISTANVFFIRNWWITSHNRSAGSAKKYQSHQERKEPIRILSCSIS